MNTQRRIFLSRILFSARKVYRTRNDVFKQANKEITHEAFEY